jgi:hypothetical protein
MGAGYKQEPGHRWACKRMDGFARWREALGALYAGALIF